MWNERKAGVITSVLKVRSIEERDAGVFTCLATCSDARITENKLKQQVDLCVKDAATSLSTNTLCWIVCTDIANRDNGQQMVPNLS